MEELLNKKKQPDRNEWSDSTTTLLNTKMLFQFEKLEFVKTE
jgi:hypothetical protein